jgi:hypothetical protein
LFKYNVDKWLSTEDKQYGFTGWAVWLTKRQEDNEETLDNNAGNQASKDTHNLDTPPINSLHHLGIVTHFRRHHFWALSSSTTLPHSTSHQAPNQAQLQPKHIQVMGRGGKNTISPKEIMVDLKCFPIGN